MNPSDLIAAITVAAVSGPAESAPERIRVMLNLMEKISAAPSAQELPARPNLTA